MNWSKRGKADMRSACLPFTALLLVSAPVTAQNAPAPAPPPAGCTATEHRQFDFWVGRWDVYPTGKDKLVAHSLIEKLYGGCTIRENWMPLKGTGGGSLNMYDPDDRRWHQTWHDSQNARVEFDGGWVGDRMVLTGFWKDANGPGNDGLVRMTYSKAEAGTVRQFGEISTDHGLSWKPFFDFTYKPTAAAK
jgi:hypothetical protein